MEENINALDEIHKGACMGMDALHFIADKVDEDKFRELLRKQYDDYKKIASQIEEVYPKYNDGVPHKTTTMDKAMTWYGIEMKTFSDKSASKLAELLLQGVNMGIIEGRKVLNNKNIDKEIHHIIDKYVSQQEKSVEDLKKYL